MYVCVYIHVCMSTYVYTKHINHRGPVAEDQVRYLNYFFTTVNLLWVCGFALMGLIIIQ